MTAAMNAVMAAMRPSMIRFFSRSDIFHFIVHFLLLIFRSLFLWMVDGGWWMENTMLCVFFRTILTSYFIVLTFLHPPSTFHPSPPPLPLGRGRGWVLEWSASHTRHSRECSDEGRQRCYQRLCQSVFQSFFHSVFLLSFLNLEFRL